MQNIAQNIAGFCITDINAKHFGQRVKKSFKYFHPNINFYLCTPETVLDLLPSFNWPIKDNGQKLNYNQARIPMILSLKQHYNYDKIIMFDGDTLIVGYLDEIINDNNHDVYGSLNIKSFHGDEYLNLGVTAFRSNSFLEYFANNLTKNFMYEKYKNEQLIFNLLCGTLERDKHIFKEHPFNIKIVDKENVYYNERSRQYWKNITIKNNVLYCNNRIIKVLHWAGGGKDFINNKLTHPDFSNKVKIFLNKITKTKDF